MPGTSFPAAILAVFVAAAQLLCLEAQQDFTTGQIPNPFTIGDSYPDRTEVAVCRPIEDYIDRNSARFSNELVTNTNNARIIFTGADTRIMSSRLLSRLNALAATYHSATGSRLRVLKAWTESGDPDVSDDRSLHFEGRTVRVSVATQDVSMFLTMAVNAAFDWVFLANSDYVRLSVIPNSCERNVDMVFMLDQSGSVGATNHDIAIQFIRNVVSFFSIGLGSTRVGLIAYSTNAYIEFDLNDHTTLSQLQNAIVSVNYRGGWTATALALNAANFLLEPNNNRGARDDSDGVPKIAVLITDGKSNQYSITSPATNLKNAGVTVYTVGIGNIDLNELRFISSDPDDDHVFILSSFNDAAGFVDFLSVTTCEASAIIEPCLTATLEVPEDSLAYFQTECPSFSNNVVVELAVITGDSYLYCSETETNPGPLTDDTERNETPGAGSLRQCLVSPTSDQVVYIGVQGQQTNNRFSLVIRDQLFTESDVNVIRLEGMTGQVALVSNYLRNDVSGSFTYSIESGNELNQFTINSGNGNIRNPNSLIFATRSSYTLLVEIVNDNSPCQCAQIRINVAVEPNTIDFAPLATREVREDAQIGTDIATVTATGGSGAITYAILSGNSGNAFEIGTSSGLVELMNPVNFETRMSYTLEIEGESVETGVTGTTTLRINVLDVNEPPVFITQCARDNLCSYSIPENEGSNEFIGQIQASDPDIPSVSNGMITYSIVNLNVPFVVSADGTIRTTESLDREQRNSYTLTFRVSDQCGQGCSLSVQTAIVITVEDENDSPPFFVNGPTQVTVVENSPQDLVVAEYEARDDDIGSNAAIQFTLQPSNVPFELDSQTGILTVSGAIDFEEETSYTITVTIANPDGTQSASITTEVVVIDQNDNAPLFMNEPYAASVIEHSPVDGSAVVTLLATDRDSNENGRISYLLNGGNFENSFSIDAETGVIAVTRSIDRERVTSFTLSVVARDNGSPNRLRASSTVAITISDINDNPPIFNPNTYSVNVREDVGMNAEIVTVFAFDQDEVNNPNSAIQYSITNGNTGGVFEMNADSGVITLSSTLDFENTPSFSLSLQAVDQGTPQMSGMAEAFIQVLNVNEDPPSISGDQAVSVSELAPLNTMIAQFEGADPDGMTVTFSITDGNEDGKFEIGPSTGTIVLAALLDYETRIEYTLDVEASDSEQTTTVALTVNVIDENEFTPEFAGPTSFEINEEEPANSQVGVITATDGDAGPVNSNITFSFLLQQSQITEYISLDPSSGRLATIGVLDREALEQLFAPSASLVSFDVVARDGGNPFLQAVRSYTITLVDINDNRPIFAEGSYENSLLENLVPPIDLMFEVSASDLDIGDNGAIRFSFSIVENLGGSNPFEIDELTGVITVMESLDCEVQPLYNLTVTARDLGSPQMLSSQVSAVLNIIDENDNAPIFVANDNDVNDVNFVQETYLTTVRENSFPGTTVMRVLATDADKGSNGDLEYSIINLVDIGASSIESSVGVTIFRIDSVTGDVYHSTPFDFESATEVNLTVVATDFGVPRRSSSASIRVTVQNVDESGPRFVDSCHATVSEDTPPNDVITQCMATDSDNTVGDVTSVTYSITSGNNLNRFEIDENTGEIRITEQLDREEFGLYTLSVTATDSAGLFASQQVKVTVQDINDNTPMFIDAPYEFYFSNNVVRSYRREVMTVQAMDGDALNSGSFFFSLSADVDDLETIIELTVTDRGAQPRSSNTTLTVIFQRRCILQTYAINEFSGLITADLLCSVEINPAEVAVTAGQTGRFSCEISRNSRVTYQWLLEGSQITIPDVLSQSESEAELQVRDFQREDVGSYACRASSAAGSLQTQESVATIQLEPEITVAPEDIAVKLGEDAAFRCLAVGTPPPDIEWFYRSELILTGSSVLMLEGVGLRDVGTYLCRAVSVAGDDVASASLVIYGDRNVVDLILTGVNNPNENGTCHYLNMDDFTSTLDQVLGLQGSSTQITSIAGDVICPQSVCGPNPCQNGGRCQGNEERSGGYECECPSGFTGDDCEDDVNECLEDPCGGEGAVCENTAGLYRCLCPASRSGHRCQYLVTCDNIDCDEGDICVELLENGASECHPLPDRSSSVIVSGLKVTDPGFLSDLVQTYIEQQLSVFSRRRRRRRQQAASDSALTTSCQPRFVPLPSDLDGVEEDSYGLVWICPTGEDVPTDDQVAALCEVLIRAGAVERCQSPGKEEITQPTVPTLAAADVTVSLIQVEGDGLVEGDDLAKAITEKQTELASATGLRIEQIMAEPPSETTGSNSSVVAGAVVAVFASVLLVALLVVAIVLALWMRKKHDRKQESKRRHALEMACLDAVPPPSSTTNTYVANSNGASSQSTTNKQSKVLDHTSSTTVLIDARDDACDYDVLPPRNVPTSSEPEDLYVNTAALRGDN